MGSIWIWVLGLGALWSAVQNASASVYDKMALPTVDEPDPPGQPVQTYEPVPSYFRTDYSGSYGGDMPIIGEPNFDTGQIMSDQPAVTFSDNAVSLLVQLEGFSPTPYQDARGWSIGYGHYMGASPSIQSITQTDAQTLLLKDMGTALVIVGQNVHVPLTQSQLDALVSFVYNVGPRAFRKADGGRTGLYNAVNANDMQAAAREMLRWTKSHQPDGSIIDNPALVARRNTESQLLLS